MAIPDTSSSNASPDLHVTTEQVVQKAFSCVLCSQRKVKCDKRPGGCANCTKVRVSCVYKAPPPPRRRKRGVRDIDTTSRLRLYEKALRQLGVDPEEVVRQELLKGTDTQGISGIEGFLQAQIPPQHEGSYVPTEVGVLVSGQGKSRYLENGIWTSLKSEFRESSEILEESTDEETPDIHIASSESYALGSAGLLLGFPRSSINLRSLHPNPVQIFKLWQLYLDNINPLVKLFHAPTVQQIISDASGDLDDIPRNVEALLFAIYCITIESLSDGDCLNLFGQSKAVASQRFRSGAQYALINANLLKSSDLMVLQAFALFILSLQNYDARVVWVLSGVSQRIGQRIGLHRDGEKLGLSPFETEVRRRLWWFIMMLEGYSQKLAGSGASGNMLMGDVKMPSNINDSDLFLGMTEAPKEHEGATEMIFFLIKCHVGDFLRRSADARRTFDGVWNRFTNSAVQVTVKDRAIDELETYLQQRFLQYCDSAITWHYMCNQLGKAIVFMMRFMAHSTEYHKAEMAQSEKDTLFDLAVQVCECQNLAYTMKEMHGFMWHVNSHFQWKAFIFLLSELRYRSEGAQVEQAWKEVQKSYDFHPSFDKELARRALPVAVNNLTLKAWDAYIAVRGVPTTGEPYFVQIIRSQKKLTKKTSTTSLPSAPTNSTTPSAPAPYADVPASGPATIDPLQSFDWNTAEFNANIGLDGASLNTISLEDSEQMDWSTWDDLMVDFQTFEDDNPPIDLSAFDVGS